MKSMNLALVATFTLSLALSGCGGIPSPFNDNPSNSSFNTNNPSSWSQIQSAMAAAVPQDPINIKQGEYIHLTQTYVFEDQVSELVSETTQTITNRYAETNDVMLDIAKDQVTYQNGHPTTVSTESPACIALNNQGCGETPTPTPDPNATPTPTPTPDPAATPTPLPTEYYNFTQQTSLQDPPALVKNSSDCGGLATCKIHVTMLSWDQIDRNDNPAGDRTHVVQLLSPDVPYFAAVLSQCITGLIPVTGGTHVLAQQCDVAVDFHFGHN